MRARSPLLPLLALLIAPFHGSSALGSDLTLKMTSSGYLDAPGVSVMLYDDNYSPIFFDQKNAAMQIILHGHRIATNGSVRLMPTPEQWDPIPHLSARQADVKHDRLIASEAYPEYHLLLPRRGCGRARRSARQRESRRAAAADTVGRAGFNLELLPSIYMDKAYAVDDQAFGVFPRSPESRMTAVPPKPGDPKRLWYVEQWHQAKGYTQPLPFATGQPHDAGGGRSAGSHQRDLGDRAAPPLRRTQRSAERLVRAAHVDSRGQDGGCRGVAHPSELHSRLDAAAHDCAQPGRICRPTSRRSR